MRFVGSTDMRPMSSNLLLFAGILSLAMPLCWVSTAGRAQEPDAVAPLNALADAIFPPQAPPPAVPLPLPPPPKPKKPAAAHIPARVAQSRPVVAPPSAPPEAHPEGPLADAVDPHKPQVAARPAEMRPMVPASQPPPAETETAAAVISPEIRQFCTNNAASAGQARVAWEAAKLKELEVKLKQRIDELESKRAEYEEWLRKRDEAMKKAVENVVAIYAKMRPEAAALQLAVLDDATAAGVLVKLKPSSASAILNEMDPGRAARLTAAMVGSLSAADGKKS
jgi:flagellar motility protein MotE (MotC chaperone)